MNLLRKSLKRSAEQGDLSSSMFKTKSDSEERMSKIQVLEEDDGMFYSSRKSYSSRSILSSTDAFFLTKIIMHLKKKFLSGDDQTLTIDEIVEEARLHSMTQKTKNWLTKEALPNNSKIKVSTDGLGFSYKPVFDLKNKRDLLDLLKEYDTKGWGGIYLDDVEQSLRGCDKILKKLSKYIIIVERKTDKRKVLFYKRRHFDLNITDEFKDLWSSVNVEPLLDSAIENFLTKNGIHSMQSDRSKPSRTPSKHQERIRCRRMSKKNMDNIHIADILEEYDANNHPVCPKTN